MKRPLLIAILTFCVKTTVFAQYYSINIDYSTIEAMAAAFSTENASEALHNENIQKIFEKYKAAEVASAGIFASKYLDRKALTDMKLWDSAEENRYYTRIYKIVSQRIIPKIVEDAELMVKDPSTAIYWGSYLMRTCNDVKSLCTQFESIVTNSRLSFKDIAFVQIADGLKDVFSLSRLGNASWKDILDNIGTDMEGTFSEDNLKKDLDRLISNGVGLAGAGISGNVDDLLQGTSLGRLKDKISTVTSLASTAGNIFAEYKTLSTDQLLSRLSGGEDIETLFSAADLNLSDWISDYEANAENQYYTQRVYIYRRDYGSETVCSYEPPTDDDAINNGDQWYRISTTDPQFSPNSTQQEAILQNSEQYAGWSRDKCSQLNADSTPYNYTFNSTRSGYILSKTKSGQYAKAYACSINVVKSWDIKETVYEEVFDSYSMDWDTFIGQMNTRLAAYQLNGDNKEITNTAELEEYISTHPEETSADYYIGYDRKSYYSATDAKKLAGATTATFTVTCSDGAELGKGSTQYKCSECGKSLTEHTRQCSMTTSLTSGSSCDLTELKTKKSQLQTEASSLQKQIDQLNDENSELLRKMSGCTIIEQEEYRNQYNTNKTTIDQLNADLTSLNQQIKDIQSAIDESEEAESVQTDDYYRIPEIMRSMKNAYGIQWDDDGSWSGYTFTRTGTMDGEGKVTFTAALSMKRKAQYFLGIKIHRAIISIDWILTSSWTDSSVADVITLNPENSEEANSKIVNDRLSELAKANPGCSVDVQISKTKSMDTEEEEGINHLLWASDRLEIARQVEARLARIYTDLVTINKFLHYKHDVIDWVRDLIPNLNTESDRKMSIAERSRRRWMHNLGSAYYEREEEDDS